MPPCSAKFIFLIIETLNSVYMHRRILNTGRKVQHSPVELRCDGICPAGCNGLRDSAFSRQSALCPSFYVNRTQLDHNAGTGKAVYDRPSDDNGTRTATRYMSSLHELYETDGDSFYASFLIDPARANGDMTFELELVRHDGGGALDFMVGIINGRYVVGNGGVSVLASGGETTSLEQLVLVRVEYGDARTGPSDLEVVTLWVDPVTETSPPVMDGVPVDLLSHGGGRIKSIPLRGDMMLGYPAFFDDLRVGSTFESVITPEPTTNGDIDQDGDVDNVDLNLLLSGFGSLPTTLDRVNLDLLLTNFGRNDLVGNAVPESTALTLVLIGFLPVIFCRRRT